MKQNTLNEHKKISRIAIIVYAIILPAVFIMTKIVDVVLKQEHSYIYILAICIISATISPLIQLLTRLIYKQYWIRKHTNISISGKWAHVHYMKNNKDYLRVGIVDIKQDFYDITMDGENYNVQYTSSCKDGFTLLDDSVSSWEYVHGYIDTHQNIKGMYMSPKKVGHNVEGLHKLKITKNNKRRINGIFIDIAFQTAENGAMEDRMGRINLFKLERKINLKKRRNLIESMPKECKDLIAKKLAMQTKNQTT